MTRLTAAHRRAQIIKAAYALSQEGGLYDWSLDDVAEQVGVSRSAVRYYFYSAQSLRRELICTAVRERDVVIVTQALAKYDPLVHGIDDVLREACAAHLNGSDSASS